ncbi:amidohydrolase family protein [Lutispora thermophila]|uniref:Aminocarboxymuconate-semialdehyde decarboxylase n=1 Tax=Lutispora thermophila DSM 19022 TaxID=1122184 RepID=A0A1M6BYI2_9FIRM|nr:amidohydrolase family protein [Lutispora thermophila]SHI53800.1 aminocarboxymuconate-semialdehyde decarboxylase [Lutispora thermophila DSM 19022]
MVIDVHSHYIPLLESHDFKSLFYIEEDYDNTRYIRINDNVFAKLDEGLVSLEKHMEDMDGAGIHHRVLSVAPFVFFYERESNETIKWAKAVNDQMYRDIRSYSNKFYALATLPMNSINEACLELERTMREYNFLGAAIATNINGIELDDRCLYPFWQRAEKLGAFILIHPHYAMGANRLDDYYLRNIIGNPLDTTIAAMRIILGGLFERFPKLRICLSHSGGYLPLAISHLDRAYEVRRELSHLSSAPSTYLKNFYYDSLAFDAKALQFVVDNVGADRMLLGTDYPFDMRCEEPVKIVDMLFLDEWDKNQIYIDNAKNILKSGLK